MLLWEHDEKVSAWCTYMLPAGKDSTHMVWLIWYSDCVMVNTVCVWHRWWFIVHNDSDERYVCCVHITWCVHVVHVSWYSTHCRRNSRKQVNYNSYDPSPFPNSGWASDWACSFPWLFSPAQHSTLLYHSCLFVCTPCCWSLFPHMLLYIHEGHTWQRGIQRENSKEPFASRLPTI